jgi:hypothetical protein
MMLMLSSGFERPYRARETGRCRPHTGTRSRDQSLAMTEIVVAPAGDVGNAQHGAAARAMAGQQRDLLLPIPEVDASAPIGTRPLIPEPASVYQDRTAFRRGPLPDPPDCREVSNRIHGLQRRTQVSSRIVDAPSDVAE